VAITEQEKKLHTHRYKILEVCVCVKGKETFSQKL